MANPICPNCGRPMRIARTLPAEGDAPEAHVFKCNSCNVDFITEDHLPVSGPALH